MSEQGSITSESSGKEHPPKGNGNPRGKGKGKSPPTLNVLNKATHRVLEGRGLLDDVTGGLKNVTLTPTKTFHDRIRRSPRLSGKRNGQLGYYTGM